MKPDSVLVDVDWGAAVEAAHRQGEGFGPLRGLKRLGVRVFGGEVVPTTRVYDAAVRSYVNRFAGAIDRPRLEPSLRLKGVDAQIVSGRNGRLLDREAAEQVLVRALTSFSREPVALPLKVDQTRFTAKDLAGAEVKVETALSAPADLVYGPGGWHLTRAKIARLLELPSGGSTEIQLAGPGASRFFANLRKRVNQAPKDAGFAIGASNVVRVVPAEPGRELDAQATTRNLMAALLSTTNRRAELKVVSATPERTTRDAKAMGITGLVGAYQTFYGGVPNRIHNVQLVAHLIDDHYIAPGAEFSFNDTTGERNEDKGFLEAPVIINGELENGLGGGVCQVSTTTFNAAYEAGLSITERTNHALYISHYPQGRDATVNYPDLDLKFMNDTDHWLWLRTFVSSSSLTVALYGTPQNRRVESEVLAARRDQRAEGEARPGSEHARRPDRARGVGPARPLDERSPPRLRLERGAHVRPHVVLLIPVGAARDPLRHEAAARAAAAAARREEEAGPAASSAARGPALLGLRLGDRLREPGRHARRPVVSDGDAGVRRPAIGDLRPVALDRVVEAEAGAADVAAARQDREPVVEAGRVGVAGVRLERQGVDALAAELEVAAPEAAQVLDPRRLEPDEVRGVVGDALRVRLREAHRHLVGELEVAHRP